MTEWIDAAAAAERLGVKPATLYAYVSRGVLRRRQAEGSQRSLFNADEVETLARRGRPRHRPGRNDIAIESRLTRLGPDRPYYRGHDALALAVSQPFENVAELLWSGELPTGTIRWEPDADAVRAAVTAQSGLPSRVLPIDRLGIVVTTLAASDPMRFHLEPPAVVATGRALISGMVDALPTLGSANASEGIAAALWPKLCPNPPSPQLLPALEAALVLLADHELAASTLAARVAASVRADPYAVVTAGLGVLAGPLHGGAALGVERLLAETAEPEDVPRVIDERLRSGERIPGFGHTVYKNGDGRGEVLLDLVRAAVPDSDRVAVADAFVAELTRRKLPRLNIDFAIATLGAVAGMVPGSGQAIFAIARTAGWLAHALEEYERRSPLRPRAVYVGPEMRP